MNSPDHDHRQCIEMFARLSEYLDNELDESLCKKIEQHLDRCKPCQACLDTLKRTVALCRELKSAPMPEDFAARLHKLFSTRQD